MFQKKRSRIKTGLMIAAAAVVVVAGAMLWATKPHEQGVGTTEPTFLYVQTAHSGTLSPEQPDGRRILKLNDVSPVTVYFSERPDREAGHELTEEFISRWSEGVDSFASNPPNAALDIIGKNSQSIAIVELMKATYDTQNKTLEYEVIILDDETGGALPQSFDEAALFIDSTHRDYHCDCTPASGKKTCKCKYKYTLGKGATKEFRGYCAAGQKAEGLSVTGNKDATTCTVKASWTGYVSRSCTNWSPMTRDELNITVHCSIPQPL